MKNSKKTFLAVAALSALSLLAGCTSSGDAGGGAGDDGSVTVAFVAKALDSPFWVTVTDGAKSATEDDADIDVKTAAGSSEAAVEEQIQKIETFITQGVGALAVAPTSPDELRPILSDAISQGIPVILVDTNIPDLDGVTSFVGTDNERGGEEAAEYIKEQLPDGGKIGLITGTAGVTSVEDRIRGVENGLEGSNIEIVATVSAEGNTRDNGVSAAEDLLTAHPDLDAIFTAGDEPALGAIKAIESAGLNPEDFIIVGFDASPDGVAAIEAGKMSASIAQFPSEMGRLGVLTAAAAARGESVEKTVDTGVEVVTKDNAADFK